MPSRKCDDPTACYACGLPFDKGAPRWRVAISDPGPAASIDLLDRREGNLGGYRWETVCTGCYWKKPPGRSIGVRKAALPGEV